jgi:HAMP domain-containing protein/GAF domain-containing protein
VAAPGRRAPADALRSASGRLAGGDLETPVTLSVDNELGAVASDLETMRRRLAGRVEALERLRHLSAQVVGATSLQRLTEVALALVPLLSRGRFLGLLALCWTERHQLDREQEALLGLAGNQIAGALEAALRLEEAERAPARPGRCSSDRRRGAPDRPVRAGHGHEPGP